VVGFVYRRSILERARRARIGSRTPISPCDPARVEVELRSDPGGGSPCRRRPSSTRARAASCSSIAAAGSSRARQTGVTARRSRRRGLVEGERVVASGNFLIAAESRLRSALEQW
jgi:hypothetical protein